MGSGLPCPLHLTGHSSPPHVAVTGSGLTLQAPPKTSCRSTMCFVLTPHGSELTVSITTVVQRTPLRPLLCEYHLQEPCRCLCSQVQEPARARGCRRKCGVGHQNRDASFPCRGGRRQAESGTREQRCQGPGRQFQAPGNGESRHD